jgi:hypothetical protein
MTRVLLALLAVLAVVLFARPVLLALGTLLAMVGTGP